jgi:P27 family predicted phage terminase small subunit
MGRGRKPTPTALKKHFGNPGRRPMNDREPQPKRGLPPRPESLSGVAAAEWDRVALELDRVGVLTVVDSGALLAYARSYAAYVELDEVARKLGPILVGKSGYVYVNPAHTQMMGALRAMVSYAAELGMTPSSRSKVTAVGQTSESDKAKLLNIVG